MAFFYDVQIFLKEKYFGLFFSDSVNYFIGSHVLFMLV